MFSYNKLCEQYGKEEVDNYLNEKANKVINNYYSNKLK